MLEVLFTVGTATPGFVALGDIRKQVEPASTQCSSMVSASVPDSRFVPGFLPLTFLNDRL